MSVFSFKRICKRAECNTKFQTTNSRKVYCCSTCYQIDASNRAQKRAQTLWGVFAEVERKKGYEEGKRAALASMQPRIDQAYKDGLEAGKRSSLTEPFSMFGGKAIPKTKPTSVKTVELESGYNGESQLAAE